MKIAKFIALLSFILGITSCMNDSSKTITPLLSRSGGEKGLRGSGAGTLGVPLEGTRHTKL